MKDVSYFPHDYNARNDEKILMIRTEFGNAEAYGMYWMIVESMAETRDGFLNRGAIAPLSLGLGISMDRLNAFVSHCVKIGLFFERNGGFSAHRMVDHKKLRLLLSKSGQKGNKKRWGGNRPPNPPPNRKERKGKKNIVAPSNPEAIELATLLKGKVLENNPKAIIKDGDWPNEAELLLRLDKRSYQEAAALIDWCQKDSFWKCNILSMGKFRKQYDKLFMNMKKEKEGRKVSDAWAR